MIAPGIILVWFLLTVPSIFAGAHFGVRFGWTSVDVIWSLMTMAIAVTSHFLIRRRIQPFIPSDDVDLNQLAASLSSITLQSIGAIPVAFLIHSIQVALFDPVVLILFLMQLVVLGWYARITYVLASAAFHLTERISDRILLLSGVINLCMFLGYISNRPWLIDW